MSQNGHIPDHELIQSVDGELSRWRRAQVRAHLEACWSCRARLAELEKTIADFAHAINETTDLPAIDGPRALLRANLAELAAASQKNPWHRARRFAFSVRLPVFASLAAAIVGFVALALHLSVREVDAAWIPDAQLTPGATRPVTQDQICASRSTEGFYPIPATLAYRVFDKYSIDNPRPRAYEVDYLITPALGGADDIRNLWPQPYAHGEWNAHVKDALEDHLYGLVCAGKLELATAQRDISTNWIAAYQKYFDTAQPLAMHSEFSLDPPWED